MSSATSTPRHPRSSPRSNGNPSPETHGRSPPSRIVSENKTSPNSLRAPPIKVKKEPNSPNMSSRPRPRRLDLSSSATASRGPQTAGAAPLPSKDSAGLHIKDLGVACLSPGFQTHDPALREQLQRSLSVRDQQRQLIEARQKGSNKPLSTHEGSETTPRMVDTPGFASAKDGSQTSRRKGPPPGLSIHAPSAASFANERVIQSAPINQSFTGLRPTPPHHQHQPSGLGQTSHIHHVPANQTTNRLPPISDVFPIADRFEAPAPPPSSASYRPGYGPSQPSPGHAPMQSPGYPPQHAQQSQQPQQPPTSSRSREYRSAEEAVQGLAGGREDLLPKIVHYGGVQPPTPPSPLTHHQQHPHPPHSATAAQYPPPPPGHYDARPELSRTSSVTGRRRNRDEYERDNNSPAAHQGEPKRYAREEADWRAGMSSAQKREEFLRLCERAWDLFHS
ncbi:hypothetical protein MBLNU457_7140t1 [Dothideomycetes sp. NU457]